MINITNAAAEKVKGILEQEKSSIPQGGLRIYVQGGGCSGFSYGMVLDEAAEGDQVFEKEGIKVIVDPMSLRYLEGAEVDYKEDLMGGGFAIKNPNATSTCGCGHSFNAGGEGGGGSHHHWDAGPRPAAPRARRPPRHPAVPAARRGTVPAGERAPPHLRAALPQDGGGRPGRRQDHRHGPAAAGVGERLPRPAGSVRYLVRRTDRELRESRGREVQHRAARGLALPRGRGARRRAVPPG